MELLNGSTLSSVLIKPMKEAYVRFYFSQIVNSLIYLRNNNIVHGDVKPDNILMSNDHKTLKLCDFGFSTMITTDIMTSDIDNDTDQYALDVQNEMSDCEDSDCEDLNCKDLNGEDLNCKDLNGKDSNCNEKSKTRKTIMICGSPIYMAPEIRTLDYSPNYKIDIWSLGMVLHEMIFGFHPFRGLKDTKAISNAIPQLQINRTKTIATKSKGITVLRSMLESDYMKRADIEDVGNSAWLLPIRKSPNETEKSIRTTATKSGQKSSKNIDIPRIITLTDTMSNSTDTESDERPVDFENLSDETYGRDNHILPLFEKTIDKRFKRTRNRLKLSDLFYIPRCPTRPKISGSCPSALTTQTVNQRVIKSPRSTKQKSKHSKSRSFSVSGPDVSYKKVSIESVLFGAFLSPPEN